GHDRSLDLRSCYLVSRAAGKRPFAAPPGTHGIDDNPKKDDDQRVADLFHEIRTHDEDVSKTGHGQNGGNGIKPHSEGTRKIRMTGAEKQKTKNLHEKLHHDTDDDQRGDQVSQAKQAEQCSNAAEGQQGNVGEVVALMKLCEAAEEVAVVCCGVRHARVAEHQGKNGGEGGPHDEKCAEGGDPVAEGPLKSDGSNIEAGFRGSSFIQFLPWDHAQNADVHDDVQHRHQQNGINHRARDVAFRLFDLAAKKADVVIAPVVIDGNQHSAAQACEKRIRAIAERIRWKAEGARSAEVREPGDDHQENRANHAG